MEEDLPLGHAGLDPFVDGHAVDDVSGVAADADDLDRIPLAVRLLGVLGLLAVAGLALALDGDARAIYEVEVARVVLLDLALDRLI